MTTRQQHAAIFRKAREIFVRDNEWNEPEHGICRSITRIFSKQGGTIGKIPYEDICNTKHIVSERLGGYAYFQDWFREYHRDLWMSLSGDKRKKKLHATRLTWLDSLIEEFSK